MLLSKRRFNWAIVALILAGIAFFVRPVRSWIDQLLVRQIAPDMKVASVHLHLQDSVVEMKDVLWSKYHKKQAFGLRADRAWLAVEPEPMLDGKVFIPAGSLENAVLFLSDLDSDRQSTPDLWQTELAEHTTTIDWDGLNQHFTTLLASPMVIESIKKQVQDWIGRSQQIRTEVRRIVENEVFADNPLRHEDELRDKLGRIEELFVSHQSIVREFANTNDEVRRRCDELALALNQQSQTARKDSLKRLDLKRNKQRIATALLLQIAQERWLQVADKARIAQLMAMSMPKVTQTESGQSLKFLEDDGQFLKADNILAQGIFAHGKARLPFRLDFVAGYHEDSGSQLDSTWNYTFADPHDWIAMRLDVDSQRLDNTLELLVFPREVNQISPSDKPSEANRLPYAPDIFDRPDFSAHVILQNQGKDNLAGILNLRAARIGKPSLLSEVFDSALNGSGLQEHAYSVRLSGDWRNPILSLDSKPPAWLTDAVEIQFTRQLSETSSVADAELREHFAGQTIQLRDEVEILLSAGLERIQHNATELSSMSRGLRGRLEDITGESFTASESATTAPTIR